jgi:imidazolonepropionase-like amidohydrolase
MEYFFMMILRLIILLVLAAFGLSLPVYSETNLILSGGTIYVSPTETPIENGVIVIRDGKVAAIGKQGSIRIPKDVAILDCSGFSVVAGFWNNHVHFGERRWANAVNLPAHELARQIQDMLTRYGFTSVFDLSSPWENTHKIRDRIESGEIAGPRIRSTGEALLNKGWMPPDQTLRALGVMQVQLNEVTNGAEALTASKKMLDAGTDGLKIFAAASFPPFEVLPDEVIRSAVNEAHRRDKLVFAHPTSRDGLLAAIKGGVDIIAHTTPQAGGAWDEVVITKMLEAKVALIPTLKVWRHVLRHDRASLVDQWAKTSTEQLRSWLEADGVILFGTDVGGATDDDNQIDEYELMADAGMTFQQILSSLTTAPAEIFNESSRLGRIVPGFAADLVVLNGDPSKDVQAFGRVQYTLRDGKIIYQAIQH